MTFFIKNMVCHRCRLAVETELKQVGLTPVNIQLGEVTVEEQEVSPEQLQQLSERFQQLGFELLDNQKMQLIEKVKTLLIRKAQGGNVEEHFSITKYIGEHIYKDYSSVSKLFSEVEGITIEQFFILQKIEKTKEWLAYDEQSLSQIAFNLGYSSTQHLSSQFKKLTGMTPSRFKQLGALHRKSLDGVKDQHP